MQGSVSRNNATSAAIEGSGHSSESSMKFKQYRTASRKFCYGSQVNRPKYGSVKRKGPGARAGRPLSFALNFAHPAGI